MTDATAMEAQARAQVALNNSPLHSLREVRVEADSRGLRLQGSVANFYQKQMAQELVRSVAGDIAVVNSIAVL